MTEIMSEIDAAAIEQMNERIIRNQFFTPDKVYIDIGLFKDIPIGVIYAERLICNDRPGFEKIQKHLLEVIRDYQKRTYDTVNPYLSEVGYEDQRVDALLMDIKSHSIAFMAAPASKFMETLIRHTVRNQNNSRPAKKYIKTPIDENNYTIEPIQVLYQINTYPLTIHPSILHKFSIELGESLGVNIRFLNKDPALFDQSDWDDWLGTTDCFYFNDLGRFHRSPFVHHKQGEMAFVGRHVFARKRWERHTEQLMRNDNFEQQVQRATAMLDIHFDFKWLQNNDVRLTDEKEDVPVEEPQVPIKGE